MTARASRMGMERGGSIPDRLIMTIRGLSEPDADFLAQDAVRVARIFAPKMSGNAMRQLVPVWGENFFGVKWFDDYLWFQEAGIRPFVMRSLAGKTIPMWVADPTGEIRRKNPRAETRLALDGRLQVLIFRKAAPLGSRKTVTRRGVEVDVPRSYPGAPGRISRREFPSPHTEPGRVGGRIARHNVGVRWRHPGLPRSSFIRRSLIEVASYHGFDPGEIRDNLGRFR